MGKTHDDEVAERGVHDGQRGGFLEDLVEGNITHTSKEGKIYHKNYVYGAQHRYGKEGRYRSYDGSGSNDPKSSKRTSRSSGGDFGGSSISYSPNREWDKVYVYEPTWDEMGVGEKIGHVICTGIVGGLTAIVYGIILVPLSLGVWHGISSYVNNKRIQPKIHVAREYNLPESSLVDKVKWDVSSFERLFSSRGPRDNNQENAADFLKFRMKNDKLSNELEENLDGLARIILDNRGRWVRFRSYFQKGDNVWVAGKYSNKGGGFICYSPDKGDTWFKQWSSYPRSLSEYSFSKNVTLYY